MPTLADYTFADERMFIIPIEHLTPDGMTDAFAGMIRQHAGLADDWIALFNQSFRDYFSTAADLSKRAPRQFQPPRIQNVCIAIDNGGARPYTQPLNNCSWLLYACDFDPAISNKTFATYQFLHADRMAMLQQIIPAFLMNLGTWLVRTDQEVDGFRRACHASTRPDAAAFVAIADAMPWIQKLYHDPLKRPMIAGEPLGPVGNTGLLAPQSLHASINQLAQDITQAAESVVSGFLGVPAAKPSTRLAAFCDWLREQQPLVVITGEELKTVWNPDRPDEVAAISDAMQTATDAAVESIRADVAIISDRSNRFLAALQDRNALPEPHADDIEQEGLSYLHLERKLIAYNIHDPRYLRMHVPTSTFDRFMLGARTLHEWGHLAVDAGWVPVAEHLKAKHESLLGELEGLYDRIHGEAPAAIRDLARSDMAQLTADGRRVGQALSDFSMSRMPDFQANLLSQSFLSAAERETYVRNNVYSLALQYGPTGFFQRLARYAYEFQYLRFSLVEDPRDYFLKSTWFREQYLATGILDDAKFDALFDTMSAICDCYEVDATRFEVD